jgi:hypothetical protein
MVVEGLNEAVEWATEAPDGWVAERFKAAVLKTAVGASSPWVLILTEFLCGFIIYPTPAANSPF